MFLKRLAVILFALAVVSASRCASAAEAADGSDARTQRRFSLVEELDSFGRNLFHNNERDQGNRSPAPATSAYPVAPRVTVPVTAPRAASAVAQPAPARTAPVYVGRQPLEVPSEPTVLTATQTPPAVTSGSSVVNRPLHERMSTFRGSRNSIVRPNETRQPAGNGSAAQAFDSPLIEQSRPVFANEAPAEPPLVSVPAAAEPTPAVRSGGLDEPVARSQVVRSLIPAVAPQVSSEPAPSAPPAVPARPAMASVARDNLLIARKSPVLSAETLGPRRISVGKESVYQVNLANSGEVAAEEVVVHVSLPAWADVLSTESSLGAAHLSPAGEEGRPLVWRVGQLPAGGREKLLLRLVPRESRPFDLAVRWDYQPASSQAMIEVQEPRLGLHLEGPREVFFGRKELFALKLANTGTGDAENVVITLLPLGSGDNQPATHRMGVLPAGEEKMIEVELTARQTGDLLIQVEVRGDHGVRAELAEKVLVRRAALQMEVQGPQVQFVNAIASYRLRLTNPGNAPARNVRMVANLPTGAKYLAGIEGAQLDANGSQVRWVIDNVPPGAEQVFAVRCSLGMPGSCRLEVNCAAEDELTAMAGATTRVDAIADLRLDVKDPAGPIALGEEAVYELRVFNRGTKAAEGVEVMAFFSSGIEPADVEGAGHKIQPGQVVFDPIASIGPGAEMTLKIRAKAEVAGAHVFRAEVHCRPLGTRLVSEETTHFYHDGPGGSAPQMAAEPQPLGASRTADRYAPPVPPTAGGLMPSPMKR